LALLLVAGGGAGGGGAGGGGEPMLLPRLPAACPVSSPSSVESLMKNDEKRQLQNARIK
jgi:hypothetical protein